VTAKVVVIDTFMRSGLLKMTDFKPAAIDQRDAATDRDTIWILVEERHLALIDFDLAIDLDPYFSDGGIVFYRMGEFNRAFADIA
jgi:hypothetical protein